MRSVKDVLLGAVAGAGVDHVWGRRHRGRVKSLIYHNVLPDTTPFHHDALTPQEFERQLMLIKELYNPVHLDWSGEVVGLAPDRINILITFDDGFINNHDYAFPILAKHGLRATFFLIVDCVETGAPPPIAAGYANKAGGTSPAYWTVALPQIREMMDAGMTFGSHTFAHTDLARTEWDEGLSIARESADRLGVLLGRDVNTFAFPWGRYRPGQPEALASRFRRLFTTNHGFSDGGDVVMRRDEAASEAHLRWVASGLRDEADRVRSFARAAWRRDFRPASPQAATSELGHGRLALAKSPDPDGDESKPLIAFVMPSLGGGGAEVVSAALGREFLKLGFRTDFVVGFDEKDSLAFVPPGAGYTRLDARDPRDMLVPLTRYLRTRRPQAVLASLWPVTIVAVVAGKLAGSKARVAVWIHSAISVQGGRLPPPTRFLFKQSISLFYRLADARVAVSEGVADNVAVAAGLRRDSVDVIYNLLLERPADDAERAAAEAIWGGWSGPRIMTVGNVRPEKNHALLVRAFSKLVRKRDARLLILGGDPGGNPAGVDKLRAYAASLGVADKVILPGAVLNPTAYYASANLFVLSSDTEGCPNVLIEALACGLPVVSTDCPYGPGEILALGRYGRLTPVGDEDALALAMLEALDAPHDPLAQKRRAADFAADRTAETFLRVLFPERLVALGRNASANDKCAE